MASLPVIKPLDGGDGYLRWKETVLLHLNAAGVAHVLSEPPPPAGHASSPAAARKWAREDALCRGHILAALSDRLLPDYARHATARAVWEAVARTYDLDGDSLSWRRFMHFRFDDGAPALEQLAHAEALAAPGEAVDAAAVANMVNSKLPADMRVRDDTAAQRPGGMTMKMVWDHARIMEESRICRIFDDQQEEAAMAEDPEGHRCRKCGNRGHITRKCPRA
ncbi:hypothetical protein ACP70R_000887 [Stipagrostis hirtigluma subsp. patula]